MLHEWRPEWLADSLPADRPQTLPAACVRLPAPFAALLAAGRWATFALPNACHGHQAKEGLVGPWSTGWSILEILQGRFRRVPPLIAQQQPLRLAEAGPLGSLANDIRGAIRTISSRAADTVSDAADVCNRLGAWGVSLQRLRDECHLWQHAHMGGRLCDGSWKPYRIDFLVDCVLLSDSLRDAGSLKVALADACRLLPPSLGEAMREKVLAQELRLPTASVVHYARVACDSGFMLACRRLLFSSLDEDPVFLSLQVDSSPQGGRDYEMIVMSVTRSSQLGKLMELQRAECERCAAQLVVHASGCIQEWSRSVAGGPSWHRVCLRMGARAQT